MSENIETLEQADDLLMDFFETVAGVIIPLQDALATDDTGKIAETQGAIFLILENLIPKGFENYLMVQLLTSFAATLPTDDPSIVVPGAFEEEDVD